MKSLKTTLGVIALLLVFVLVAYASMIGAKQPTTTSFNPGNIDEIPEHLNKPAQTYYLPDELMEISGMTYWKTGKILAVQDEKGKLFSFDLTEKSVTEHINFGKDLDYEGLAHKDSTIYILEMDGDIRHFDYQKGIQTYQASKFETAFTSNNDTEGLCYDPVNEQLLIVPKGRQLSSSKYKKNVCGIYPFDLRTGSVSSQPLYKIDLFELGKIVYGEDKAYKMKPSGIAVHPKSGNIYVIASVGKILVVLNRESKILRVELLDTDLFPQPEGITFSPSGELFISSEGKGSTPKIVQY